MKNFLTLTLIALSLVTSGQNYKAFHKESKKLFIRGQGEDRGYGIAFDSATMVGNDSVYFNYTGVGNMIISDTCVFWGGENCLQQNQPSWIGTKVIFDNEGTYHFITNAGDNLNVVLNNPPGDSVLFYSDNTQNFYLQFEGTDTLTILGLADSARIYRIIHTDISGNTIYSDLNNEKVTIGKSMGLIDFFRVDSFPQILEPVHLTGNASPDAGLTSITNEMLYDHQPGDVIQYYDYYFTSSGWPGANHKTYIKHHFLDRANTNDSIIYTVARTTFDVDSSFETKDTIQLKYVKNHVVASIPFDVIDQSKILEAKRIYRANYCDFNLWTYEIIPGAAVYCDADNCWGAYDSNGPPPEGITKYACGLGVAIDSSTVLSAPPYWFKKLIKIVYFKKDGIECGEETIVGIEDEIQQSEVFIVYPNPVDNYVIVQTNLPERGSIILLDMNGRQLIDAPVIGSKTSIDVSDLKPGIYLIKFISGSRVEVRKLVKE
jgi:hypothetical protein